MPPPAHPEAPKAPPCQASSGSGGRTPPMLQALHRRVLSAANRFSRVWQPINLDRIQRWVADGRLDASTVITMKAKTCPLPCPNAT